MLLSLKQLFAFPAFGQRTRECFSRDEKAMRSRMTSMQIDDTLRDSFPASDPPCWH
jgi:hypothetical protein